MLTEPSPETEIPVTTPHCTIRPFGLVTNRYELTALRTCVTYTKITRSFCYGSNICVRVCVMSSSSYPDNCYCVIRK